MKYLHFLYLSFLLLPGLCTAQSLDELGSILFPKDQNLQEVFDMMQHTLKKKGARRFYKIASEGNNRKNMPLSSVAERGLSGRYGDKELSIYTTKRAIIRKMKVEGRSLNLFGSTRLSDHLETLKAYPDLIYEYQNGKLAGFLLPQMKAMVLLKYTNRQLSKIEITRSRYTRYKKILEDQQTRRIMDEVWERQAVAIDETRPLNLADLPATCVRNCDKESQRWLFGHILYRGPIVNGRPEGEATWARLDSCAALFSHAYIHSGIYKGRFEGGMPVGWHTVNHDSMELELKYEQGRIVEVKGTIVDLPLLGKGRVAGKLVNGQLNDPSAVIYTGKNNALPMAFVRDKPQPNGPMTYTNRNGEEITINMRPDGQLQGEAIMKSPRGGMVWTIPLDQDGQFVEDRSRLAVRYWDIGQRDLYPKSIVVEGTIKVDLVNEKWGGENLTITFPGTNLTLTGTFLPAFGFTPSTFPHGTHTLRGSWKGKTYNQTAEYENGHLISGESLYKISEDVPTEPVSLNYYRVRAKHGLFSHEREIELPISKYYGIAIEQAVPEGKVCEVDIIFMDKNDQKVYTKTVKNVSKLSSVDFKSFRDHNKKPLQSVIIRRKKCRGFLWVYFYD